MKESDGVGAAVRTWSRTPVGSQRSLAEPGSAEYFRDLRSHRYGYETPFIPTVFNFAGMKDKTVLEVGVGNGIDAVEMAKNGAHYSGIDITARHLELTAQHFRLTGLVSPPLFLGELLKTDVGGPFDFVYSFGVLHHIDQEAEYLVRARELLRPGGRLLIGVYSQYSAFNAWLLLTWAARGRCRMPLDDWRSHVAELSPLADPVTIKIRSRRDIESLLRACGFQVAAYWKRGFAQSHLPGIGRRLRCDGFVLTTLGRLLGWYHLFECIPRATMVGG